MQTPAKHLGRVRVWKDGEQWKWTPADNSAPANALLGDRYADPNGGDVIYVKRGGEGEYIRGAAKAG